MDFENEKYDYLNNPDELNKFVKQCDIEIMIATILLIIVLVVCFYLSFELIFLNR